MPLPAKLPVKLVADFSDPAIQEDIRTWLLEYKTPCEYMGECDMQAMFGYLTAWTALWVCTKHHQFLMSRAASERVVLDRRLSEERYERFLRRSYVHTNNLSNFELETRLLAEKEADAKAKRSATQRRATASAQIRRGIAEQTVKIGAPDEELIAARQAQPAPAMLPLNIPQLF